MNELTKRFAKRYGLGKAFPAMQVIDVANRVARGRFKAVTFKDGRLVVEVPTGPQLFFLKKEQVSILEDINSAIGSKTVEKLTIRGV